MSNTLVGVEIITDLSSNRGHPATLTVKFEEYLSAKMKTGFG
jgi:hypothetical protein